MEIILHGNGAGIVLCLAILYFISLCRLSSCEARVKEYEWLECDDHCALDVREIGPLIFSLRRSLCRLRPQPVTDRPAQVERAADGSPISVPGANGGRNVKRVGRLDRIASVVQH